MHRYFIIYKPINMVSQFVSMDDVRLLGAMDFDFPEGTHAIGRLDKDSEGLLILTTDKRITKLLFEAKVPHKRSYLVMVRDVVSLETLETLRTGVTIEIEGGKMYTTSHNEVEIVEDPHQYFTVGEDYRLKLPNTWLHITLTEGKFHQVRKMVRAVRHPCRRLVRVAIEGIHIGDMLPGEVREMDEADFFRLLKIDKPPI